ncbi:polyphosphate kinase 2 [Acidithiobacillus sp. HP-6]|uniref:polyphosphate kinase 2 n=1 Tax=unclassified Acidithiobacillus TaxID=2614800 RepID=UPI00187A3928|nr:MULTISPECIES: polyphosphate kinase 2 [unclassified Acidithiobacillus]MBE7562124.1 polyphosphate kinase 2 [Acidithiobacillus sp. HP-6]MBE7568838.1 polyphosphate kinase 2 [Acidithiobacillus sp. HP-2]MDD2751154.1 polyphosphate kinase 2 [Acidithiobacillus sp.]MDD5279451.1 polyphosphate kinase 2 [Acidithiobacillus sp.]
MSKTRKNSTTQSHQTEFHEERQEEEKARYKAELRALQIELVKLQRDIIRNNEKILVILEGRDSAGKDGSIKRIIEHLSPRETRVVALSKPSDKEQSQWYFQRYVEHLPSAAEMVFFNRSWYNRAGVEKVMGFCSDQQYEEFFAEVNNFEGMLIRSGIHVFKFYLDISREEQKKRLESRKDDPLKQWKTSPIDEKALKHWKDYSEARNVMFARSHSPFAPWIIVNANDKKTARLQLIKGFLSRLSYTGKDEMQVLPDQSIIFEYESLYLDNGMIQE